MPNLPATIKPAQPPFSSQPYLSSFALIQPRTGQKSPLSQPHSPRPSRRCKANRSKPFKNPPECKAYVKRCHISFFHALLGKLPLNSL